MVQSVNPRGRIQPVVWVLLVLSCQAPDTPLSGWRSAPPSTPGLILDSITLWLEGKPVEPTAAAYMDKGNIIAVVNYATTIAHCELATGRCEDLGIPQIRPFGPVGIVHVGLDTALIWTRHTIFMVTSANDQWNIERLMDSLELQSVRRIDRGISWLPYSSSVAKLAQGPPDRRGQPLVRFRLDPARIDTMSWIPNETNEWQLLSQYANWSLNGGEVGRGTVLTGRVANGVLQTWTALSASSLGMVRLPYSRYSDAELLEDLSSRTMTIEVSEAIVDLMALPNGGVAVLPVIHRTVERVHPFSRARRPPVYDLDLAVFMLSNATLPCVSVPLPTGRWRLLDSQGEQILLIGQASGTRESMLLQVSSPSHLC